MVLIPLLCRVCAGIIAGAQSPLFLESNPASVLNAMYSANAHRGRPFCPLDLVESLPLPQPFCSPPQKPYAPSTLLKV